MSGAVTDSDRPSALSPEPRTIESLALLKAITSSPTVGFGFVDRDCRIVRLNAMLAAITGGTVEEQIGRTVAEAVPHLWPQLEAAVRHVLESGEDVVNHEVAGEGAGGEADRHWLASFHAVEGAAGEVVGVAAIVFDVTERRRAERFSEQLIETSNAIVLVLDPAATVLDFNRAGEEITGYTREELVGRNWDVVVPRDRYPEVWDTHRRLVDEGAPQYANPIVTKAGVERFILWQNSRRVERGDVIGTVSFGIDVTESVSARRDAERSLEQVRAAITSGVACSSGWCTLRRRSGSGSPAMSTTSPSRCWSRCRFAWTCWPEPPTTRGSWRRCRRLGAPLARPSRACAT